MEREFCVRPVGLGEILDVVQVLISCTVAHPMYFPAKWCIVEHFHSIVYDVEERAGS